MIHFICNPTAGGGNGARCSAEVDARMRKTSIAFRIHSTRKRGEARHIARSLSEDVGSEELTIVSMGGDGTLHEVLNGITDPAKVNLGIIPCGSGNDFAAAAGIPSGVDQALELILNGEALYTDYLECCGVRGINAIGTGIDVDILRRYNKMRLLKGSLAYMASLVLSLFTYKPVLLSEKNGEDSPPHKSYIVCCCNGRRIGGGICISPVSVVDDGLFDIVFVDDMPAHKLPTAFIRLIQKRILEDPAVTHKKSGRIRIESDGQFSIQIDGEIYEGLPFDVNIRSGILRVYRPHGIIESD